MCGPFFLWRGRSAHPRAARDDTAGMTHFMDHTRPHHADARNAQRFEGSEQVQAELDRLAAVDAEHPGWTAADFDADREAERAAEEELAAQLHEWNRGTRQRNARRARHDPWN